MNGTNPLINLKVSGSGVPTTTTRSAGTKLILWDYASGTTTDYAIGISPSTLWYSVGDTSSNHNWYAGTTSVMLLTGAGNLTTLGSVNGISPTQCGYLSTLTSNVQTNITTLNSYFSAVSTLGGSSRNYLIPSFLPSGTTVGQSVLTSYWFKNGSPIAYTPLNIQASNVRISSSDTTVPTHTFEVNGDAYITGALTVGALNVVAVNQVRWNTQVNATTPTWYRVAYWTPGSSSQNVSFRISGIGGYLPNQTTFDFIVNCRYGASYLGSSYSNVISSQKFFFQTYSLGSLELLYVYCTSWTVMDFLVQFQDNTTNTTVFIEQAYATSYTASPTTLGATLLSYVLSDLTDSYSYDYQVMTHKGSFTTKGSLSIWDTPGTSLIYTFNSSTNAGYLTLSSSSVGTIGLFNNTTGVYTYISDVNRKTDIQEYPSEESLSKIIRLKPKTYTMIGDDSGDRQIGFIAQEVKEVNPCCVKVNEDGLHHLAYNDLFVHAIGAIQELVKTNQQQQVEIEGLKDRCKVLEDGLLALITKLSNK